MALWLNYRPDSAPPPAAMSLNAEPAVPEEREAQHLPPKSYADAAEEALEPPSHVNGTDGAAESTTPSDRVETDGPRTNGVGVLRITDTHMDEGNGDDKKSLAEPASASSKQSSIKDQESYEGAGIDDTPKSPKAKSNRRKSSRSSLGSVGRTYGVSIKNDVKNAATDVKHTANHVPNAATDLKNQADGKIDEHEQRGKHQGSPLHEKPQLSNGEALTTVKPPMELEKTTRIEKSERRNSELKAGRQAGAGWAQSKYVRPLGRYEQLLTIVAEYDLHL